MFQWIDVKVGAWRINRYNAVHVFLAIVGLIIFAISCFQVVDLSKELDAIKAKYSETKGGKDNSKKLSTTKQKYDLMRFKDYLQADIISLTATYGVIKYATNTLTSMISMYALSLFHWPINVLSWMYLTSGFAGYFLIIVLVYLKVFKGMNRIYYVYITACSITLFSLVDLLLPKVFDITSFSSQMVLLVVAMFVKCWIFFHAQSSGKVLIFNTVSPDNSCSIDGLRSAVGAMMRCLAISTAFLFYLEPQYFVLPIGIIQFLSICMILCRHKVFLDKKDE